MDNNQNSILASCAEWKVMECLWKNGPLYMAQIIDVLGPSTGWKRSTIITLASRLEKKGYLGTERSRRAFLYVPVIQKKEAILRQMESFAEDYLNGKYYPAFKAILDSGKMDKTEERKLYLKLRQMFEPEDKKSKKNKKKRK